MTVYSYPSAQFMRVRVPEYAARTRSVIPIHPFIILIFTSASENQYNKRMYRNNTSGARGVFWYTNAHKLGARIRVDGHLVLLGSFFNKDDAVQAYREAASRL